MQLLDQDGLMIDRKVFVLVINDSIKCYHNLRQLTEAASLPYFKIRRALAKYKIYRDDGILIGYDTVAYKTKRTSDNFTKKKQGISYD